MYQVKKEGLTMLEYRIAKIGLILAGICGVLAWITHAWYYELSAFICIGITVFGYAYMDK